MNKIAIEQLEELREHPGWQLITERRRTALERFRRELLNSPDWDTTLKLQATIKVLEMDEINALVSEFKVAR